MRAEIDARVGGSYSSHLRAVVQEEEGLRKLARGHPGVSRLGSQLETQAQLAPAVLALLLPHPPPVPQLCMRGAPGCGGGVSLLLAPRERQNAATYSLRSRADCPAHRAAAITWQSVQNFIPQESGQALTDRSAFLRHEAEAGVEGLIPGDTAEGGQGEG